LLLPASPSCKKVLKKMTYRKTYVVKDRKTARRRLLLDSATKLFASHGYHATTVPMIVARAGGSTGSFYLHFRNKEDVFYAALEELAQELSAVINEMKTSETDHQKRIPGSVETLFLFLAQNPERARILIVESSGLSPRLEKVRRGILLQHQELIRQTLKAAPELFRVENMAVAERCIVGSALEALYCWLDEDPEARMLTEDVARAVGQFNSQAVTDYGRRRK
jgi:AcrR family transcriptional regulator